MPSTDVATVEESSLELLPPTQAPSLVARQMLVAHAEMMQTAWELASKMCNTKMVPARFFQKPEDGTAAILYGAELGLNPIQSLQRVIPIHGMPSMEARTMVALLKARGYKVKTTAQSSESVTVQGIDLDGETYEATWTIERARQAGYVPEINPQTGKYKTNANGKLIGNEKYLTDPQAMLKAKAQSEVCRDMAPDVLMGISYTSEELQSENWDNGATLAQAQVQAPKGRGAVITTDDILADEVPVPAAEPVPAEDEARADAVQRAKDHLDAGTMPDPSEDIEAAEAYAEQNLSDDEALTYLSGGDGVAESDPADEHADHLHVATDTEPEPAAAEPEPENAPAEPEPAPARKVSSRRAALERRLVKLIGAADIGEDNTEDQLIVYRFILGRNDVQSVEELSDEQVGVICDALYDWQQKKQLGEKVTDILNNATLASESE
ncbi:hypothetical protein [Mycobacterium sp. 48b]|uniref:hypothetical protein n=1 Tax=Mycobacterium sp. 48b TaxID=3400426 RepID=UPI003AABEAAE